MTEPEIDTAIDRAVRDLMNVDADAAFRTRVTARLERPARRTWVPRLLTAVVTAAAIIAALIWMRPPTVNTPESTAALGSTRPAPVAAVPATRDASQPPDAVPPATPAVRPDRLRSQAQAIPRGLVVAAVAEAPSAIPPLTALDPIDVEPISQTPIATARIVVAPLSAIPDLQVSPLEPPTAR